MESGDKNDSKAFLFSLDKKEKYNIENEGFNAIKCGDWGFYFKDLISIPYDSFLSNNKGWANKSNIKKFKNLSKGTDLTNGLERFKYKEVEVYQINYY